MLRAVPAIVLLLRGRLSAERDVYLTGNDADDLQIAEAIDDVVPCGDDSNYLMLLKLSNVNACT